MNDVINSLSPSLREKVKRVFKENENIEEIRLRVEKPLIFNLNNRDYFFDEKKKVLTENIKNSYIVSKKDIENTFQIMCKHSIHSFIDDIKKGFITLSGGHRVGIAGKVVIEDNSIRNIKKYFIFKY